MRLSAPLDGRYRRAIWWALLTQIAAFAVGYLVLKLPWLLSSILGLGPGPYQWNQWPEHANIVLFSACVAGGPFWMGVLGLVLRRPRIARDLDLRLIRHGYWVLLVAALLGAVIYVLTP